jgi:hypothetical protein
MHNHCKVKVKAIKKFPELDYTIGVHQGDNMSPVLFLFVIQAFLETLRFNPPKIPKPKDRPSSLTPPSVQMTASSVFKPDKSCSRHWLT